MFICLALASLTSCAARPGRPSDEVDSTPVIAEEAAYRAAIEKRTTDILPLLDIADAKGSWRSIEFRGWKKAEHDAILGTSP